MKPRPGQIYAFVLKKEILCKIDEVYDDEVHLTYFHNNKSDIYIFDYFNKNYMLVMPSKAEIEQLIKALEIK